MGEGSDCGFMTLGHTIQNTGTGLPRPAGDNVKCITTLHAL